MMPSALVVGVVCGSLAPESRREMAGVLPLDGTPCGVGAHEIKSEVCSGVDRKERVLSPCCCIAAARQQ